MKIDISPKFLFYLINYFIIIKVTDIYWRAIGRDLIKKNDKHVFDGRELQKKFKYHKIFFTIGLTRFFEKTGKYHPMVVGVHIVPYFPATIDYNNI